MRQDLSTTTLDLTSKVLLLNPEYYTIWNQRRRVLQNLFTIGQENATEDTVKDQVSGLLTNDLQFLVPLLLKFPKCYWIWNHRYWLLRQTSALLPRNAAQKYWTQELGLVSKMLGRDGRNFHGWNYRRFVISGLQELLSSTGAADPAEERAGQGAPNDQELSIIESEFAYTTKMIKSNLSNFSAWHNRSKLIPRLLDERKATMEQRKKLFDGELAFIQQGVFTDPYDQSLWYYHHFLFSELARNDNKAFVCFTATERETYLKSEIEAIKDLLEDTDDCKWVYHALLTYVAQYLDLFPGDELVTTADIKSWLQQVRKLDPMRRKRWDDFQKSLDM